MKKRNKILLVLFGVLFVISFGIYLFIRSIAGSGSPDYNTNLKLDGLKDEVTVYRDKYGIPHIYAKNHNDLYRATGYVIAQDRMWQIDLLRKVTQGRLSEIFGEEMIENDVILRALRMPEKSREILKTTENQEIVSALQSFADGINQYIKDNENNLPFEFKILDYKPEDWKPEHSINLIGYMAWNLKLGWSSEILIYKLKNKISKSKLKDLIPNLSSQENPVFPDFKFTAELNNSNLFSDFEKVTQIAPAAFKASNNWVVSGRKSTTGKPIFANDMHLGLSIPGVWTQIHQNIAGELDVTGVMLPGEPCVVAGHNENIAWGMTNVMLDCIDFYVETVNPENPNQYKFNGKWKNMEIRKEKIKVKGKDKIVEREIRFTHRGPVISGFKNIKNKILSMHWTGNEPSNELRSLYLLNRAKNWNEFREAVKTFGAVSQNIAYADIQGNIGLQTTGTVPVRKAPGYLIFPGETDEYDWKGFVPFDSLPYSYNPESGYLHSANNKTVGDDYPHYLSAWFYLPYRNNRINEMINEKEKLSPDDFKKMHNDQKSVMVDEIKPVIIKYIDEIKNPTDTEKNALDLLKKWNNILSVESPEAMIFEEFYLTLAKNIVYDELGDEFFEEFLKVSRHSNYLFDKILKTGSSDWCDDVNTPEKEDFGFMIKKSFSETIKNLIAKKGKNISDWKWGDVHKMKLIQPLGKVKILDFAFGLNREFSVGGSYHTVSPYNYSFINPYISSNGASHRHIYNLANFDKSWSIIPTGISGIPSSRHYCDQSEMYVKGIYHEDFLSKKIVMKKAEYKMTFKP